MIPGSNLFPWNWTPKTHFSAFAWAFGHGDRMRQTFHIYQKMRRKIPHFLIPKSSRFGRETPTHKGGAHAISKLWGKLKNRIPRELDQNIGIAGISVNHRISSILELLSFRNKKRRHKKVMAILNPGIQPRNAEIMESYLFIADNTPVRDKQSDYGITMVCNINVFIV